MPKIYSDAPGRRAAQVVADVLAVLWVYLWIRVSAATGDAVRVLGEPGARLEDAAGDLSSGLGSAADSVGDLPFVGPALGDALGEAASSADGLAQAGRDQQAAVADVATLLTVVALVTPLTLLVIVWLIPRIRFVRRASAAQRFVDADADLELFALRAMTRQPFHRLAGISDDPVGAWRAGDAVVVRELAVLELRTAGLRPPAG